MSLTQFDVLQPFAYTEGLHMARLQLYMSPSRPDRRTRYASSSQHQDEQSDRASDNRRTDGRATVPDDRNVV